MNRSGNGWEIPISRLTVHHFKRRRLGAYIIFVLIAAHGAAQSTLFGPQQIIQEGGARGPISVFASDLDGDGDQDVLWASEHDNQIAWHENLGAGAFGPRRVISTLANRPMSVVSVDLDGDGDQDVLSASFRDHKIAWYENTDGKGAFGPQRVITTLFRGARSVFAADFDGDGDQDVVAASFIDDKIAWFENTDGKGAFGAERTVTTLTDIPLSVFAADLDADGDQDILSASAGDDKIAWYENRDGKGAFGPQVVINMADTDNDRFNSVNGDADGAGSVFAADIDGDGDQDVLSSSNADDKVAWYENINGKGAFGPQQVITNLADAIWWVFAADLDGDGDQDVLSASATDDKIAWYENTNGKGAFGPQQVITTLADLARSVFAADLDGDGDLDLLSASGADNKIAWYENLSAPVFVDFAAEDSEAAWIDHGIGGAMLTAIAGVGAGPVAGLCIFSPVQGANIGVWESPRSGAIPLSRNSVYRIRFTMSTDQAVGSAQPVWNILVDNLDRSTGEIIWGSVRWFSANAGFANGIGNSGFNGLTQFDAWIVPNPVSTDAWNGLVDEPSSPFSEGNLEAAAFNLKFRVLDIDPIPGATTEDTGTVCLRSVQVDRYDLTALDADGPPLWGSETTAPPEVNVLLAAASGTSVVDSAAIVNDDETAGTITIELDEPTSVGTQELDQGIGRALVRFEDDSQSAQSPLRLYPVPWNDGELLRLTAEIRARSGEPNNPVDVIGLGWQAATNELGGFDFSFRGQPGGLMDRAASPRDDSVANSTYTSFFYTHHSTDIDLNLLPDANRLRGVLDFFNRTDLAGALGDGNLSDPFEIRSMAIHRIVYDEDLFGPRPAE